jgi:hypothetical protein
MLTLEKEFYDDGKLIFEIVYDKKKTEVVARVIQVVN